MISNQIIKLAFPEFKKEFPRGTAKLALLQGFARPPMAKVSNLISFIGNKEIIERALRKHKYEEIFTDRFAQPMGGNFGHATRFGNQLIAKNAADHILEIVDTFPGSFRRRR